MAVQQFCLRWNNHQPNFISVFTDLLNNETLVDVTLAAEGKQLQAHKVVLSACSTYFQALFTSTPCQHPIVILKDIKYNDLKTMVDFMYYGEVNVSQDQLPAILKTAETLKVKGLAEMPEGVSLSKSDSQGSESPWSLRRKRLRKSSTGSSEQTSTEDGAAGSVGSGGTLATPSPLVKQEIESEHHPPPPTRDPSTESDTARSHSFDTDEQTPATPSRNLSEEQSDTSNIKWSSSEEQKPSLIQQLPGWDGPLEWEQSSWDQDTVSAKRKRSVNPQGEENFIAALEAVRSGRLGFCKAAKVYGVNNRTLWLEYKRRGYPLIRPSTKAKSQQLAASQGKPCIQNDHHLVSSPDLNGSLTPSPSPKQQIEPPPAATSLQPPCFTQSPFMNRFPPKYEQPIDPKYDPPNPPPYYLYSTL